MTRVELLRLTVFGIWFLTLMIIVVCFAVKLVGVGSAIPLSFGQISESLQIMVGLVVPQLTVMIAFYFNFEKHEDKLAGLTGGKVVVVMLCSIAYHVLFIACAIGGIVFNVFDHTADGEMLQRNTAAIVAIMGLLSILGLGPVAYLFAAPQILAGQKDWPVDRPAS